MRLIQESLNEIAETSGLNQQDAINIIAGTTNKGIQEAANVWNGSSNKLVQDCYNEIAGTTNLSRQEALDYYVENGLIPTDTLKQQLFKSLPPAIDGTIYDERKTKGSARPIQTGRAYLFDGTNDYVATTLNFNTVCQSTFSIEFVIDPTDGQPASDQVLIGGQNASTFGGQGAGATNGFNIWLYTTGKLSVRYKAGGNLAQADTNASVFINGTQPSPRKFRALFISGAGISIQEYIAGVWTAITLDPISNGSFSTNNVVMSSFSFNANIYFGARNSNGTADFFFAGELAHIAFKDISGNPYALYNCEEQYGVTAYDASGNSKHGVITNATLSTFHATQTAYEPYLNTVGYTDGRNFLTYSQEFENAIWTKEIGGTGSFGTVTANAGTAPDGTTTADRIQLNRGAGTTSGDFSSIKQALAYNIDGISSVYMKSNTGSTQQVLIRPTAGVGYTTVNVTTDWQRFSIYNSASNRVQIVTDGTINQNIDILAWGGQLELGSTATDYQRTTAYPYSGFVPRNETTTTQDVLGTTLQYSGEVPYNADAEQANGINFDGTNDYADFGAVGTVTSFKGWVKLNAANQNIWTLTNNINTRLYVVTATLTGGASLTLSNIKINGVSKTAAEAGVLLNTTNWCYLEVDFTSTNATSLQLGTGGVGGSHGNIRMVNVQFYNGSTLALNADCAEGAGIHLYCKVTGTCRGALINGPTWIKQDVYHANLALGFSKYMYFNGTTNRVLYTTAVASGLSGATRLDFNVKYFLSSIPASGNRFIFITPVVSSTGFGLFLSSTGALTFGARSISTDSFQSVVSAVQTTGLKTITGFADFVTGEVSLTINGVTVSGTKTFGSTTYTAGTPTFPFQVGDANSAPDQEVNGVIYDLQIEKDHVAYITVEGYGVTNADWIDKTNGALATVEGSPSPLYIPAVGSLDLFGNTLRNPAGAFHNGAESLIDFRANVNSPVAVINAWETAWAFNTARTNPEFKRTLTSGGVDYRADRFLAYNETLSGTNLTKVQNYTATKAI